MSEKRLITQISLIIVMLAGIAAYCGIYMKFGDGPYIYESIRSLPVEIYGTGLYHHMPADVAIQGIAQDYVTLFIAIPILIISLIGYNNNSLRCHFLLSGVMGYLFVTYLFYTTMAMYNVLFLCYVTILCLSFFGLFITMRSLLLLKQFLFSEKTPAKAVGGFLMFNAAAIALLWLSIIVPPLVEGTIYPTDLNHFTTLIVQGLDLALLLPICFVIGLLLFRQKESGYIYSTVYLGFLSILMTALTAKVIAMGLHGDNVIPVIFIIPTFNIISILSTYFMINHIQYMGR